MNANEREIQETRNVIKIGCGGVTFYRSKQMERRFEEVLASLETAHKESCLFVIYSR
jgi:hypothetical protein